MKVRRRNQNASAIISVQFVEQKLGYAFNPAFNKFLVFRYLVEESFRFPLLSLPNLESFAIKEF